MVRPIQFEIERVSAAGGICRLLVTGELDLATTPRLEQEASKAIAEGASTLVIDLMNLRFIDSTGLRMFLQLNRQAASEGWRLVMARPSEQVKTILRVTGSGSELPITEESVTP